MFGFFCPSIVAYCVRYTTFIACNVLGVLCVCVSLYNILVMLVCMCVCVCLFPLRMFTSLLLLIFLILSTIKYYSIFVLLQHFLQKKNIFALCSIFLYSILIPYFVSICMCVCVCVYVSLVQRNVSHSSFPFHSRPPQKMELIFRSTSNNM